MVAMAQMVIGSETRFSVMGCGIRNSDKEEKVNASRNLNSTIAYSFFPSWSSKQEFEQLSEPDVTETDRNRYSTSENPRWQSRAASFANKEAWFMHTSV